MNTPITLIGLVGPAGSGKDTAAQRLVEQHGFVAYALAEPIRTMLYALFSEANIPSGQLFSPESKAQPIDALHGATPRHLMQSLGTEWGRKLVGEDVWLTVAERHLGLLAGDEPVADRIVITDVRFANEAAWVRRHGGTLVSLERPGAGLQGSTASHSSEAHITEIDTHLALMNNGSIAALWDQVDGIASALAFWEAEGVPLKSVQWVEKQVAMWKVEV